MKKGFLTSDWFTALVIAVVVIVASGSSWMQSLERSAYDVGVRATSGEPSDRIAVVAIDQESIENLGRWPWPRSILAEFLDSLSAAGAKVIASTILLTEPQLDPGLELIRAFADAFESTNIAGNVPAEIEALRDLITASAAEGQAGQQLAEFFEATSLASAYGNELDEVRAFLQAAVAELDTDARLAQAITAADNIVMPMLFQFGEPLGNPDSELPPYIQANSLGNVIDETGAVDLQAFPISTNFVLPPLQLLGEASSRVGHLNANPDVDGAIRTEPLVLRYYDAYYPSLSLQIAAKSLNLEIDDILIKLGEGVQLGRLNIRTDPNLQMYTFFYQGEDGFPAFGTDSFFDVITGKIPAEKYRDKIVLIGATAPGLGAPQVTPVSPLMEPVVTLAHSVSSILNEDFFTVPEWAHWAEWATMLLGVLFLVLALPRLKAGPAFAITLVLIIILVAVHLGLMMTQGMWLKLMAPVILLAAGYLLLTTKRFLVTERGKEMSEMQSAQSNRMLALAFQGQGQLDMAFEHFRKCPLDESILDLLYNLALDFERKRQFNKAGAVYQYMSDFDAKFRDVEQRLSRSRALEDTVMLGGTMAATTAGGTMVLDAGGGVSKPMLGRYEVEKELGKGAMGIVYLGRDPKINRVVAIKTMALSQEFEADELDEVKERFFREAETAGRLSHPNIVTIFDAGEEHDLAYIAMEFLKGKDLADYTKPDQLLPMSKVIELMATSADALNYAHLQNVVHRDIKPANIMYEDESGELKLTDFGIARITDSSKTKTGMVLGTPSYMSPEQLSGKKVDGRSDLFSLGVMCFQLLTGQLPFKGDSMATLMFMIANEAHPDITAVKDGLPPSIKRVIDKALAKDADERYQTGAEFAADLRKCAAELG